MQEDLKLHWIFLPHLEVEIYFSQKNSEAAGAVVIQCVVSPIISAYFSYRSSVYRRCKHIHIFLRRKRHTSLQKIPIPVNLQRTCPLFIFLNVFLW